MIPSSLLGIFFALTSALVWGSADFNGGLATRRNSQFQVLVLSSFSGIIVLVACAFAWGEHLPTRTSMLWAGLAGAAGALGLAALYRGLWLGHTASVAPTAAVVGAASPVLFGIITEGWPGAAQLVGFALAMAGIWLVSRSPASGGVSRRGMALAFLAGIGFGGFFILIGLVQRDLVFAPLVVARCVSLATALLLLFSARQPILSPAANPIALLAGVLDAGGNVFYLLARQNTRLDIAVVLSSLYPAATVLLARFVLKERVTPAQWIGVALCLAAVGLIAV